MITNQKPHDGSAAFKVVLHWTDSSGTPRASLCDTLECSPAGMRLEAPDPIEVGLLTRANVPGYAQALEGVVKRCERNSAGFIIDIEAAKDACPWEPGSDGQEDLYEILQLSHNATVDTVQRVFRIMAARYHPDNNETGNLEKFLRLNQAYATLSNPEKRAAYDAGRQQSWPRAVPFFNTRAFLDDKEGESNRRLGVLCLLYVQRRRNGDNPSLSMLELEQLMSYPREYLEFTLWYLRQKQLIERDETSRFMLTATGVDYVEEHTPVDTGLQRLITGRI